MTLNRQSLIVLTKDKFLRFALLIKSNCKKVSLKVAGRVVLRGGAKHLKLGLEFSECISKGRRDEIVHGEDSG
jgi:hypothetical protein